MFFKKSLKIMKIMARFSFKRVMLYPLDSIMNFCSSLVFLIGSIIFWFLVTSAGFMIEGWSYQEILVFVAFSELFFGLDDYIFSSASNFWYLVYSGLLDTQLTRPFDPRKRFIFLNIDYAGIISTLIKVIAILLISGITISWYLVLLGFVIVFLASLSFMYIRFVISNLCFWIVKMDALTEICNCLTRFNKYPVIIFPKVIRICFSTILPFYFFSTFPAQFVLGKLDASSLLIMSVTLMINILLWIALNNFTWEKGRRTYENING